MDYSFYGGRRGAAFIISGRYSSITEMINKFKLGSTYTDINFNEYVLIDTEDKNNPDNGKLYKRGYNFNDSMGGAEYIGQIVGPSGNAPNIRMATADEIANIGAQFGLPAFTKNGEYKVGDGLIPGKDGVIFNDSIKWSTAVVRDSNNVDTIAYFGFTFPYLVTEYESQSVDAYYNRSNETATFLNNNLITRIDDETHPFYSKYKIAIPKGIKGNSFNNLKVINATDGTVTEYPGQPDDKLGKQNSTFVDEDLGRKILIYEHVSYDKNATGTVTPYYLGDFNIISDVAIDDDGTVRIAYTHDDNSIFENKIKWIKDISITQAGLLTVNYNYGADTTKYETNLKWIDNVSVNADGTINFGYNDGVTPNKTFSKIIKWIDNITLSADGTLRITYNNGSTDTVFSKAVKWITEVSVNTGTTEGTGNQKIKVTYNNGTSVDIGSPLNYIMKTALSDDYHLLVLYSDPAKRAQIKTNNENAVYEGRDDWHDLGSIKSYNGVLIGANYDKTHFTDTSIVGIIGQLNTELPNGFPSTDIDKHGKIVTVGIDEETKKFFAFNYTKNPSGTYLGWYYLGSLGNVSTPGAFASTLTDPAVPSIAQNLLPGSLWFLLEE